MRDVGGRGLGIFPLGDLQEQGTPPSFSVRPKDGQNDL